MYPTHVYTVNGEIWMTLDPYDGTIESELGRLIGLLDGSDLYSFILWRLPPGKELFDTKPSEEATDYMQYAERSEQLVVEVRTTTADGGPRQLVIGRETKADEVVTDCTVAWSTFKLEVKSSEVFSVSEATKLFSFYYEAGDVAKGYTKREVVL